MLNFLFGKKNKTHYHQLVVEEVIKETSDTVTIHFRQPDKDKISYKSGQFLTLIVNVGNEELRRSYSMSSSPATDSTLAVTVKRIPNGKVSNYLNDTVKKGQTIQVMNPAGNFTVEADAKKERHVILIGAGSGVTPLISMAKTILQSEAKSVVSLLFGNRTENSIIFKEKIQALQSQFAGRFYVEHILSQPHQGWAGHTGRLNQHLIIELVNKLPKLSQTEFYMCGPAGMMEEANHALSILEVKKEDIHKESFVTPETEKAKGTVIEGEKVVLQKREVTVIYEGSEYKFTVTPDQPILHGAIQAGIDLPYSCQSGMCTACRGKCVSGKVKLDEEDGLSEIEIKQGYILTCVGHPLTDDVVIEIG